MKKTGLMGTTGLALLASCFVFSSAAFASVDERIDAITADYADDWAAIEEEGRDIAEDAPDPDALEGMIGIDFKMETIEVIFDLPTVYMRTQEIKLDLPQVTMKTRGFSLDVPKIYMEIQKIGEYPCFRGLKVYSCDILTKVPVAKMERVDMSFDVPEFTWDTTSIKLDIPEFEMHRVEWKFDVPKAEKVSAEVQQTQDRAGALSERAVALGEQQKAEVSAVLVEELGPQRIEVQRQFEVGITQLQESIATIVAAGIDPRHVPDGNGGFTDLQQVLDGLVVRRDEALAAFDAQTASLQV